MQKEPWDPSVKGLTSVPQVLAMMNDKLDWTQQLGEAFLAQPDDIQNAIQALRARADEAGNLKSSKEQKVRKVAATPSPGYAGPPNITSSSRSSRITFMSPSMIPWPSTVLVTGPRHMHRSSGIRVGGL
jgi:hypothetical protein